METLSVIIVEVKERAEGAPKVNGILSKYGDLISARLGFHTKKHCPEFGLGGLICAILTGDDKKIKECYLELNKLRGVEVSLKIINSV